MSLDEDDVLTISPSYFWSCVTLSDDCPFFSPLDPMLRYFGLGIAGLYCALLLVIISDMSFYWAIDNMQKQINYYMNLVTSKVKRVQMDQRKLITTQERTERQLRKSIDRTRMLSGLRSALYSGDLHALNLATTSYEESSGPDEIAWNNIKNFMEY